MGLDMYAFTTRKHIPPVDFDSPDDFRQIAYWRKHPNLQGWMKQLYEAKGGRSERDFNCDPLQLTTADLDALEQAVLTNALPDYSWFFCGATLPEHKAQDIAFLKAARQAIADGNRVFYTSWW